MVYLRQNILEEPSSLTRSHLFIRRQDITTQTRVKIAYLGKYCRSYGTITRLSEQYDISRTFVYILIKQLGDIVDEYFTTDSVPSEVWQQLAIEDNLSRLLRYRLEGGMSLSRCSTVLKGDGVKNTSYGWCSESLQQIGALLPNVVDWQGQVNYTSDEIYYIGHCPILVTVDPVSGAMLSISKEDSLTKAAWVNHWKALYAKGIQALGLSCDEGQALQAARQDYLRQVPFQPDTFHAITHQFYKVEQALLRKAHQAIKEEYTALEALHSLVTPSVVERKTAKYLAKKQASVEAIDVLEDFQWLYHHLRRQFKVIRSNGQVRQRQFAEGEAQAALDLLFEMPIDWKKIPEKVNKLFPDLFNFLDTAECMQEALQQLIEPSILPFWMRYWQYQRSLINLKKAPAKNRLKQRFEWLEHIVQQYEKEHPDLAAFEKNCVFTHLNSVMQSSSMVECTNSILRPYIQQARGQISQEMLNLIMFYHNHRKFNRGKRKGYAPFELLCQRKLDIHWLDLLMDIIKNNSKLFGA